MNTAREIKRVATNTHRIVGVCTALQARAFETRRLLPGITKRRWPRSSLFHEHSPWRIDCEVHA